MKEIKINSQTTLHIPENWSDILLSDYESWYDTELNDKRDTVSLVAKICKVSENDILDMPVEVFNFILNTISFIYQLPECKEPPIVKIDGTRYTVNTAEKLTTAQWIDAESAQRENKETLSGLLAIACAPIGKAYEPDNFDKAKALFAKQQMNKVMPLLSFFLSKSKQCEMLMMTYWTIKEQLRRYADNIENLQRDGRGIKSFTIWQRARFWILTKYLKSRLSRC